MASTMSELPFVVDDKKHQPHFQGKWKPANGGRPLLKASLNIEWLEDHFDEQHLGLV